MKQLVLLLFMTLAAWPCTAAPAPRIISFTAASTPGAQTDSDDPLSGAGPLRITTSDGHTILVPGEQHVDVFGTDIKLDQSGFTEIRLAKDGVTLGWVAEFMACAQSYPCAVHLVIYRAGRVIRMFEPDAGIVWDWCFLNNGAAIAMHSGFPHGDATGQYTIYNTLTGKILKQSQYGKPLPDWVSQLPAMQ